VELFSSVWAWLSQSPPAPDRWLLAVSTILGAAVTFHPAIWRRGRYAATWVHEAGHALAAILSGRTVTGMTVGAQSGGVTTHVGAATGFGRIFTAAAGYPAPAILGATLLALVGTGNVHWATALIVAVAVVLLPLQRSWRSFLLAVAIGGVGVVLATYAASAESVTIGFLAGYFIAASPRTIIELHKSRSIAAVEGDSDADALADITRVPAIIWEGVFLALSAVSVAAALWLILN